MTPERWQRTEELYHAARSRPAPARAAFLAEACGDDEALRREVESLLSEPSSDAGFLAAPVLAMPAHLIPGLAPAAMVGRTLGGYQLQSFLGAGGMGEVYRAHDSKLGREVAIKILPRAFTGDRDRLARFEREARMLAALSHPNICAIHGLDEADGIRFLVLELVDGETLAQKLADGRRQSSGSGLAPREALDIARQIAEALEVAHEKGIVHRDLKPANICITSDGVVKVLDFGLAKTVGAENTSSDLTRAPAVTQSDGGGGPVIGTAAYMSPEQTRGQPIDRRTDIWAFGCVLYEMLTGRSAFGGATTSEAIAAVLKSEPDWLAIPPETPASVQKVIARCLAKDRARRFHAIADARIELEQTAADEEGPPGPVPVRISRRRSGAQRLAWLFGVAWLVTLVVAILLRAPRSVPGTAEVPGDGIDIPLPPGTTHWSGFSLSPDGRRLAIVTVPASATAVPDPRLWIRDLRSHTDWQPVSGSGPEIPQYPFWSPDSQSMAFFLDGKLVRADLPALVSIPICPAPDGRGGVWLDDQTIVFAPDQTGGLQRVESGGGTPTPFVDVDRQAGETSLRLPASAGLDGILYLALSGDLTKSELRLVTVDDRAHPVSVVRTTRGGAYFAGTLFYERDGRWVSQRFDPGRVRFLGDPKPISLDAQGNSNASVVAAVAGRVAIRTVRHERRQATWVDRTGRPISPISRLGEPAAQDAPDISPDGRRVAVARYEPHEAVSSLWIVDDQTSGKRLVAEEGGSPVWRRDGARVAFRETRTVGLSLYEAAGDVSTPPKAIFEVMMRLDPIGWMSGSDRLAFVAFGLQRTGDMVRPGIYALDPAGKREFIRAAPSEPGARLSADGTRIAYLSRETGELTLFVDAFPGPGTPIAVAHGRVSSPRWKADGQELYFVLDGHLMAASVSSGQPLAAGTPGRLFDLPSETYAVHPDGERFLVMVPTTPASYSVRVIDNWWEARR